MLWYPKVLELTERVAALTKTVERYESLAYAYYRLGMLEQGMGMFLEASKHYRMLAKSSRVFSRFKTYFETAKRTIRQL